MLKRECNAYLKDLEIRKSQESSRHFKAKNTTIFENFNKKKSELSETN